MIRPYPLLFSLLLGFGYNFRSFSFLDSLDLLKLLFYSFNGSPLIAF
ncbi:hypothetical protein HMPREF1429_01713 [Helicobacter pylori GAM93Bi]|nr:hypothetical protein HMPREF1429_01713 [Helicobacter pylori GAM93Bi]